MTTVKFEVVRDEATCECGVKFGPNNEDRFEVSTHLRQAHNFVGEIDFEITAEVICPRRQTVVASFDPLEP